MSPSKISKPGKTVFWFEDGKRPNVADALDKDTHNMIDGRALDAMQAGSFVITTARGGIVDEEALAAALKSGHIAGAGVDVWMDEPLVCVSGRTTPSPGSY